MQKERFEWIHSWCDETASTDLPRVLLVGDSITHGYQEQVRELLKGVCFVDYVSTSYSIDQPIYNSLIKNFYFDSKYDVLHFNHGLHGKFMNVRTYKSRIKKLLSKLGCKKTIIASSTVSYLEGNKKIDKSWQKIIDKRNPALKEIAKELGYLFNDLYRVSLTVPKEERTPEGVHYTKKGYEYFARQVAEKIKEILS